MTLNEEEFRNTIRIGLIQTNCAESYWGGMSAEDKIMYSRELWSFIQGCFAGFQKAREVPDIVLLPELAIPRHRLYELKTISNNLGIIVIAGLDYLINSVAATFSNEACVIVPEQYKRRSATCHDIRVGKIFAAPRERDEFSKHGFRLKADNTYYVFDGGHLGRFGVAICYDLMDLQRATLYTRRIQHLFVLAYNKDIQSFLQIAEALSRIMFCNITICNTGRFGGSVVIAPYYRPWKRLVYRHEGAALGTSQIVEIPVRQLVDAQQGARVTLPSEQPEYLFKHRPPLFETSAPNKTKTIKV
jgi:hypothetical protein